MVKSGMIVLAGLMLTSAAQADGLTGDYVVSGTGLNGSPYKGTAKISQSDSSCAMTWRTPDVSEGYCFEYEGVLMGAYASGKQRGIVFYKIMDDGSLAGVWNVDGSKGTGTEILNPKNAKSPARSAVGAQKPQDSSQ